MVGCSDSSSDTDNTVPDPVVDPSDESENPVDIFDAVFIERSADCADYVNVYDANVMDIKNTLDFNADVVITATETECTIASNSVPNHNFNHQSAAFAGGAEGATISATDASYTVTRFPQFADAPTFISQQVKNAVFLNGVLLDIVSAGCYLPTSPDAAEDGNVGIGCASDADWLLDPLGTESKFGADENNAHTQPGGLYHYHGSPNAMFDDNPGSSGSPVIGFAADGFPVFGSYFYDSANGSVRKALSGYSLKSGTRGTRSDTNPGGEYDGTYNQDYEFTGSGDLDECNGMTVDGQYGYYVTDSYPWVLKCLSGTPDESFIAGGGTGPTGPPPGGQ